MMLQRAPHHQHKHGEDGACQELTEVLTSPALRASWCEQPNLFPARLAAQTHGMASAFRFISPVFINVPELLCCCLTWLI